MCADALLWGSSGFLLPTCPVVVVYPGAGDWILLGLLDFLVPPSDKTNTKRLPLIFQEWQRRLTASLAGIV